MSLFRKQKSKSFQGLYPWTAQGRTYQGFPYWGERGESSHPPAKNLLIPPTWKILPPQMVNFPTWIPGCDSHSLALLGLFLSSDTSIVLQWLFLYCETLVMFRPWHDVWAITHTNTISRANQGKGGLHRPWKACPNIKLCGLILLVQNSQ